jgi:pyruvate/2-oxoacid:ferredoxin oxidoreductase beta subunit
MTDDILHYCPGCGHSTVHRIIAEIIDEEGIQSETIGISPVGCSVYLYNYIDIDCQEAAHGRAPALATAIKRLMPINMFLLIRVMVILPLSGLLKLYMPVTGEKIFYSVYK